jgi:membrane protease YdiL (CAAX protease family)
MARELIAIWRRLPVFVRAPVVAFVVMNVGSTLGVLPIFGNTKFLTNVPWALPATLAIMWAFWRYATGSGYPAATRVYRATMTRDKAISGPVWRAAMLAVIAALIATWSLRLVLPSILPVAPPTLSIDFSLYPVTTVIGLALAVAVSAGVVEEIAFRGYLQKSLEDAYGIVPALILTGFAFWYAHADKVTVSHLPFHLAVSVLLGTATYLTRSLLPAIVGHVLGDALLLPAYVYHHPDVVWSLLTARPVWEGHATETVVGQLRIILTSVRPGVLLEPSSHPLAVISWTLIVSSIAAVFTLRRLARVVATSADAKARLVLAQRP